VEIELLIRKGVAADEVLQSGEDFDRIRLVELELHDVADEGQNGLEIGSLQVTHASQDTPNGE